jgi:hypothetical protein
VCDYKDPNVSYNVIKTLNLKDRLCKYCGWNVDEPDLEVLSFFHQDCWKNYRKEGLLYPMPKYA